MGSGEESQRNKQSELNLCLCSIVHTLQKSTQAILSPQPVSRSTSELPQLEVGRQPSEKVDKPDKQDSKPVKPVSLDTATVTGQSSTPDKQDTQKQVLPVKPEQAVGGDDGEVVQDDRDGGEKLAVEDGEDKEVAIVGVVTTKGSAEEEEEVVPAISVGRVRCCIYILTCT